MTGIFIPTIGDRDNGDDEKTFPVIQSKPVDILTRNKHGEYVSQPKPGETVKTPEGGYEQILDPVLDPVFDPAKHQFESSPPVVMIDTIPVPTKEPVSSVETGTAGQNAAKAWTSGWWKTEEGQKWATGIAIAGKALDALRKGIEARKGRNTVGKLSKKKKKRIRSRYT